VNPEGGVRGQNSFPGEVDLQSSESVTWEPSGLRYSLLFAVADACSADSLF